MEVVERYMREYFADMDSLGVARPDISRAPAPMCPSRSEPVKVLIEMALPMR